MKFWYVVVMEGYTTVFSRRCMSVKEANELLKQKKEEYPGPKYAVSKEYY